jgi:CBS domain-containing protein
MKTRVKHFMTSDPVAVARNASLDDVARLMVEFDCGLVPVLDHDAHPVGVITDRDMVMRSMVDGKNPLEMVAAEVMSEPVVTVRLDADIERVVELMEHHRIRRVIVVDEDGRCEGIVAQADISRRFNRRKAGELVEVVSRPDFP